MSLHVLEPNLKHDKSNYDKFIGLRNTTVENQIGQGIIRLT